MPQVCSFLGCNPSSTLTFDEGDHSNKSCAESTHTFMFQPGNYIWPFRGFKTAGSNSRADGPINDGQDTATNLKSLSAHEIKHSWLERDFSALTLLMWNLGCYYLLMLVFSHTKSIFKTHITLVSLIKASIFCNILCYNIKQRPTAPLWVIIYPWS